MSEVGMTEGTITRFLDLRRGVVERNTVFMDVKINRVEEVHKRFRCVKEFFL